MKRKHGLVNLFLGTRRSRRNHAPANVTHAAIEEMESRVLLSAGSNVVDPAALDFAVSFGGENSEYAERAISDATGNIYTIGTFEGTADFDPGIGTFELTGPGGIYSLFLSKLDDQGNLEWAKHIGYQNQLSFSPMRIDGDGN
ncbi:MAG: hypothetical protein KDA65_19575, partial [Planctomycetaceae bacterium]|nr:hypothetical protein [Planctomycetaceae bacterium]